MIIVITWSNFTQNLTINSCRHGKLKTTIVKKKKKGRKEVGKKRRKGKESREGKEGRQGRKEERRMEKERMQDTAGKFLKTKTIDF